MRKAGGRLFVDVTQHLAAPVGRASQPLQGMGQHYLLMSTPRRRFVIERAILSKWRPMSSPSKPEGAPPAPAQPPIEPDRRSLLVDQAESDIDLSFKTNHPNKIRRGSLCVYPGRYPAITGTRFDRQSSAVFMAAINAAAPDQRKHE